MGGRGASWTEESVGNHPCDIFEPAEPGEHGYVVLYLHGVHIGRLHDKPTITESLTRHGLFALGPITQRSWWTDRICREFDEHVTAERHVIDRVIPYVERRWGSRPPQIALLGTSMGGQGALRLAFKYPDIFPVVAAISPAIDYHTRFEEGDETLPLMYTDPEEARQDTATLHVHPLNWPRHCWFACDPTDERWFESSLRLQMKLSALGIPHVAQLETAGGGHGWQYYQHMGPAAIDFLVERLDSERLRIA